jgi:hypothetical protein
MGSDIFDTISNFLVSKLSARETKEAWKSWEWGGEGVGSFSLMGNPPQPARKIIPDRREKTLFRGPPFLGLLEKSTL